MERKSENLKQIVDKNSKLEEQIFDLEDQLNEAKYSLNQRDHKHTCEINKLNDEKLNDMTLFETEKSVHLKAEKQLKQVEDQRDELLNKLSRLDTEHATLKRDNIEMSNQLEGFKAKFTIYADLSQKNAQQLEINKTIQAQLTEFKNKNELLDNKCTTYSQKFDILIKKYEARKIKQKQKIERLW
jgi:chromosome segregation ATPase